MAGRGRGKLGMPLQEGGMEAFLWHRAAIPKALLASGCAQSGAALLLQRAGSVETWLLGPGKENRRAAPAQAIGRPSQPRAGALQKGATRISPQGDNFLRK